MRDLLDFDIVSQKVAPGKIQHTIKHNKREGALVEFYTGLSLSAADVGATFKKAFRAYADKYREKTLKSMTKGQRAFYDKLIEFHRNEGRAPSYDEQCVIMGCSSKGTPHYYVKKLIELGWIWTDKDGMVIPIDIASPDME